MGCFAKRSILHGIGRHGFYYFWVMFFGLLLFGGCATMEKNLKTFFQPFEADLRAFLQPWYKPYGFKKLSDTREFAAVPNLIKALKDPSSVTRREAAKSLGLIGPDAFDAVPELIHRLDDMRFDVRNEAAIALEKIDPQDYPEAPQLILINALGDKHYSKARAAAIKLGEMGPEAKRAVRALIKAMNNEENWYENYRYVRVEAAKALGAIGPDAKEAVPALVNALYSLDPALRREAAHALGKIGPAAKDAVPTLGLCLDETFVFPLSMQDWQRSINPFFDPTTAEFIKSVDVERINQFIRPAARHWIFDHKLRREAAWALGEMGAEAKAAAPALAAAMNEDPKWCVCDHDVRIESIRSLGKIGPGARGSAPALAKAAETDASNEVRREALIALGQIGSLNTEGIFQSLLKSLNDQDPQVRIQAIRALTAYDLADAEGRVIHWDPVNEEGVLGYIVCYSSETDPERCIDVGDATTIDFRKFDLKKDKTYMFNVAPYDYSGQGQVVYRIAWSKRDVIAPLQVVMVEDMNEQVRKEAGDGVRRLMLLRGP